MAQYIKDKEKYWMTRQEYEEKGIYVLKKVRIIVGGKVRKIFFRQKILITVTIYITVRSKSLFLL